MGNFSKTICLRPLGDSLAACGDKSAELGYKITENNSVVSGVYCFWNFENGEFWLDNDQYGMYPIFYAIWKGALILTNDILAAIRKGVPAELDHDALATFLRLGFHVGYDTPYRFIKRLPPSARLMWKDGDFTITGMEPSSSPPYIGSLDNAIDDYIALFSQSMRRILKQTPEFQLPLSGGRDSRHILLESIHLGCPPKKALTAQFLPPRSENDTEVASNLLVDTGIEHEIVKPYTDIFRAGRRHDRATQYMTAEHVWSLALGDALKATRLPVLDGLAGDTLSAGLNQTLESQALFMKGNQSTCAEYTIDRWQRKGGLSETALAALIGKADFGKFSKDKAIKRVSMEIERHKCAHNPLQRFNFFNRTKNGPAMFSLGILSESAVYFPYLDYELFRFLDSLPADMVADHRFHSLTIRKAYPKHSEVDYAAKQHQKNSSIIGSISYFSRLIAKQLRGDSAIRFNKTRLTIMSFGAILRRAAPLNTWWSPRTFQFLLNLHDATTTTRKQR